ncbi:MAG TPA: ribonuclease HI family protein [Candidatus Thermoplasmatota archaeon]|nr:ribonuclease HI family protein [Candidatus Thermoplasmatota archaeon]
MKGAVWFDGACSGNPGPMGAGAVVQLEGGRPQPLSLFMGQGTNNEAEYHGLILGLRHALAAGVDDVVVQGDSQLILRQVGGSYKVKAENLRALNAQAVQLLSQFAKSKLEWVPREENSGADAAARAAIENRLRR